MKRAYDPRRSLRSQCKITFVAFYSLLSGHLRSAVILRVPLMRSTSCTRLSNSCGYHPDISAGHGSFTRCDGTITSEWAPHTCADATAPGLLTEKITPPTYICAGVRVQVCETCLNNIDSACSVTICAGMLARRMARTKLVCALLVTATRGVQGVATGAF
jgi:hypothetical protein